MTLLLWCSESPLGGVHLSPSPLEGFPDNWLSLYTEIKSWHGETRPAPHSLEQYTDNSYKNLTVAGGRSISSVQGDLLSLQSQP